MYVCMCVRVCIKNANSIKSMKTIYVCMCLYNNNNNLAAAAKTKKQQEKWHKCGSHITADAIISGSEADEAI